VNGAAAAASVRAAPAPKWGVLFAVGVGTFMSAMGGSAVYMILPVVARAFGADVAAVEWVLTVHLLVVSTMLLSFGRLGDLRGHRRVYVSGFVLLLIASGLCGLAPTTTVLIAARAAQALGSAMIFANGPAILTRSFPASQRGRALGMQAGMTYLGLTAGPSLGGWFAALWGWRAIFFLNLPVGLVAIALTLRFVPEDVPPERREPFDLLGAALFTLGLGALLIALNRGHDWGWHSAGILGAFLLAVVLLAAFVAVERWQSAPMLDLDLFRRRAFSAAVASAVLNYICVNSVIFLLPFYLMDGRGLGPARAGVVLTTQPIVMAIVAPVSGALSDRIGSRALATVGMTILAAGLFFLSRLGPASPLPYVALALVLTGLGTGIFGSPNNNTLMGSAPRHRQGIAGGVLACARSTGMVLGVGLAAAVFTTVLAHAPQSATVPPIFSAIDRALLVAAVMALLGIVTSAVR
jgi:EmrB/QacA subfamily drug resistance transporter